jgi:transcriptional regulator with XRE-family HTH domain
MDGKFHIVSRPLGHRIRSHRISRGLTQDQLGRATGACRQLIQKYETGHVKNIPLDQLQQIAAALDIPLVTLLEEIPQTGEFTCHSADGDMSTLGRVCRLFQRLTPPQRQAILLIIADLTRQAPEPQS